MVLPEVEEFFSGVCGTECWSFIGGAGAGSIVSLGFGAKVRRKRPLQNPTLREEERQFEAERCLLVYWDWRFERDETILCSSQSAELIAAGELPAVADIKGRGVKRMEFISRLHDLRVEFDNGVVFTVFCNLDPDEERSFNYVMFNPDRCVAVTTKGRLAIEGRMTHEMP